MGLSEIISDENMPGGTADSEKKPDDYVTYHHEGDSYDVDNMLINYNDTCKGKERVLFRNNVIEQMLAILIGKDKPNALLVGPAGSGKTAIVETLADMIDSDDPIIPDSLKGYTIYELPLSNIIAGSVLVGELESKIKTVIAKMQDPDEKNILFIDEIHQLVSYQDTYAKIAQVLKPALARGQMHVIGATTTQEASNLMRDPAFSRRFSKVIVDELTREQTLQILEKMKPSFISHYKTVTIDSDLLSLVADLADQYRPAGSHRPDNALTLLDRVLGEAVINKRTEITEESVKKTAVTLATGNQKAATFNQDSVIKGFSYIRGQDKAVKTCIRMMQRTAGNLFPRLRPTTMLFIGPSGVGKTETAKIIAKETTGQSPIVLNMTEYSSSDTINRIIGSPAGYVGYNDHNERQFDVLESNPFSVILLDEFEKADKSVQRLFFSVFDEGKLTDNHGKTIDFSKAIIIATTNAGHQETTHTLGFGTDDTDTVVSIQNLSEFFDPALLNRFQYLVNFSSISKTTYQEILADT